MLLLAKLADASARRERAACFTQRSGWPAWADRYLEAFDRVLAGEIPAEALCHYRPAKEDRDAAA